MTHTSAPHVLTLSYEGLGDRSYLAHDGRHALVVDPQRDIDLVEQYLGLLTVNGPLFVREAVPSGDRP